MRSWRRLRSHVTGTSFAAPIVSFLVGLLLTDTTIKPGDAKERIIFGSDYSDKLAKDVFSSGTLNISKVLGFDYDIIKSGTRAKPILKFGRVNNKPNLADFTCSGSTGTFNSSIRKLSYDPASQKMMMMVKSSATDPSSLRREICDRPAAMGQLLNFTDAETGETSNFSISELLDYVAMQTTP